MKLFYRQYGESGEALFILHGIFGMLDNWHNIARALSSGYKVFTIDARNHGQSPHSEDMSYTLMAEDVFELADDLGIESFILLGHSMGGKTAMRCALMHPERIKQLVVADIAPKAYKPGHLRYFEAFENTDWGSKNSRGEVDAALATYEDNATVRLFLAKNIDRADTGGFRLKANIPAIKNAYPEIVGEFPMDGIYNKPALFILGANSMYLLESDKPAIMLHFPSAEFQYVANAGHWVHADNPSEFLEILLLFLKRFS